MRKQLLGQDTVAAGLQCKESISNAFSPSCGNCLYQVSIFYFPMSPNEVVRSQRVQLSWLSWYPVVALSASSSVTNVPLTPSQSETRLLKMGRNVWERSYIPKCRGSEGKAPRGGIGQGCSGFCAGLSCTEECSEMWESTAEWVWDKDRESPEGHVRLLNSLVFFQAIYI